MMKKSFAVLLISFLFSTISATASAVPLRFEENVHYKVVSKTATAQPTLTEYFSFYCPSCFRFEPVAQALEKILPDGAKFEKSHVDFVGRASKDIQMSLNKAVAIAKKLNMSSQVNDAIFNYIHVQRKNFNSEQDIIKVMIDAGVDEKKLASLIKSFGIKGAAKKMKNNQTDLTDRQILTGVPMFLVNGKYKILPEKLRSQKDYNDLVLFLLAMK